MGQAVAPVHRHQPVNKGELLPSKVLGRLTVGIRTHRQEHKLGWAGHCQSPWALGGSSPLNIRHRGRVIILFIVLSWT